MHSLPQSKRVRGAAGEPLPMPWKTLEKMGLRFPRGQLIMVCAGPGTGKSAFVLNYALKAGVPTLYFSADSDAFVQFSRAIAILSGMTLSEAGKAILEDTVPRDVEERLGQLPIRMEYNAAPTLDDIEAEIECYLQVFGEYPSLVVLDNITDVSYSSSEEDDGYRSLDGCMKYLNSLARETEACVIALHHVTGKYNDANTPIPLSGVKGQISGSPSIILTLDRPAEDDLRVAIVKFRGGKASAAGDYFAVLDFRGDVTDIRDKPFAINNGVAHAQEEGDALTWSWS